MGKGLPLLKKLAGRATTLAAAAGGTSTARALLARTLGRIGEFAKTPLGALIGFAVLEEGVDQLVDAVSDSDSRDGGGPEVASMTSALLTGPGGSYAFQGIHDALMQSYIGLCFCAFTPAAFERARMMMQTMRYSDIGPALKFKNQACDAAFVINGVMSGALDPDDVDAPEMDMGVEAIEAQ